MEIPVRIKLTPSGIGALLQRRKLRRWLPVFDGFTESKYDILSFGTANPKSPELH
jgi:hypothetical protein